MTAPEGFDAFVTKLGSTGSALVYSTYLGGGSDDLALGIALDALGNASVTGHTLSRNFPTTPDAYKPNKPTCDGSDGCLEYDAFVTTLNATGSGLVYSTYFGGSSSDSGSGIAKDTRGNVYVTGDTTFGDFPTTAGAFQPTFGGGQDAFVAKFSVPTRFEESAATYTGTWTSYGAETGSFSGGAMVASNQATATASFSFTGRAVTWIGVKCNLCGTATVSIDGGAPTLVNTAGPADSNLTSEPVYSASGLDPAVTHTMVITVTGASTSLQALPFSAHVAVDAFDVTR